MSTDAAPASTTDAAAAPLRDAPIATLRGWMFEALICFGVAVLFAASAIAIRVYPPNRMGAVAGLSSLALRFLILAVLFGWLLMRAAKRRDDVGFAKTTRWVCAALAGMVSGMIGGGVLVALRGTPYGINALGGDAGALVSWTYAIHRGDEIPALYPPLPLHIFHYYAHLVGIPPEFSLKHLQILGTVAVAPFAYLSWRLLLSPPWALGIGVMASLPLVEPYKPFPNLVLIVFLPAALLFLRTLRELEGKQLRDAVRSGVVYGVAFGVMFLMYSGWFKWAAPGLFAATLWLIPWRNARRLCIVFFAVTALVFLLLSWRYLAGLFLDPTTKIADNYFYFDTAVEPMYIAMWKNDTPGLAGVGQWPPHGELGGVGLFTVLLIAGFGVAMAIGRSTLVGGTLLAVMLGAWFLRFWHAHQMWQTKLVQLYPRTTPLILYCMMMLTGYGVIWLLQRLPVAHPLRSRSAVVGSVCALAFLYCSAGSSLGDRYMPLHSDPPGPGWLTLNAYQANWARKHKTRYAEALPWLGRLPRSTVQQPERSAPQRKPGANGTPPPTAPASGPVISPPAAALPAPPAPALSPPSAASSP